MRYSTLNSGTVNAALKNGKSKKKVFCIYGIRTEHFLVTLIS